MKTELQNIKKDLLILRFSFYGFFKNLKFFEPYLILFLLSNNFSLFQIGILFSIREITINLFEIPSGLLADTKGRKIQLESCFIFYIISFIIFYFSSTFLLTTLAMILFGMGEAFRSGSHKAIILSYLETKGWEKYKTFVYGRTRSFSLMGSAISSVLAIFLILYFKAERYLFLISVIPYIIDFFLILSYPKYLNFSDSTKKYLFKDIFDSTLKNLVHKKELRKQIGGNALFEGAIKSVKDYIQPIFQTLALSFLLFQNTTFTSDEVIKINLGIIYAVIYLISSIGSRKAYKILDRFSTEKTLNIIYISLPILFVALFFAYNISIAVFVLFTLVYFFRDVRKPIFLESLDNNMEKQERATVLSFVSQCTSIATIIIAPLMGYLADTIGINKMFLFLGVFLLIIFPLINLRHKEN